MPDIRHSLQNLADAISPETGTRDGFTDTVDTSIKRIADALPGKLNGVDPEDIANAVSDYLDEHPVANVTAVAASASISDTGLITYNNSSGTALFTLQLPVYNGSVSGSGS